MTYQIPLIVTISSAELELIAEQVVHKQDLQVTSETEAVDALFDLLSKGGGGARSAIMTPQEMFA